MLVFNFPNETGLVQFVLFLIVLVLVARMSRADDAGAARASRSRRASPPVPERLREIWWVRRMPQLVAGIALVAAIVLPLVVDAVGPPPHVLDHPRVRDRARSR